MTRRPLLLLATVVMVCVVGLLVGCAKEHRDDAHAQRLEKLRAVYDAVAAVTSATEVGTATYENYSRQLPKASEAMLAYTPEDDSARGVVSHLSAAMYAYQTALRAWATEYDECQDCAWRKFAIVHPQYATEDAQYAVHTLWNSAAAEMKAAQEELTAYARP